MSFGKKESRPSADDERSLDALRDTRLTSARSREAGAPEPLRVLLAEDDPTNALLANTVMKLLGCEVITVGSGDEAVNAIKRGPFDVVLMDFHMPVMDGLAATRAIRQWEAEPARHKESSHLPHIPIIAITASAMPAERDACLRSGMDDILVKPFRLDDLRRMLERWSG